MEFFQDTVSYSLIESKLPKLQRQLRLRVEYLFGLTLNVNLETKGGQA